MSNLPNAICPTKAPPVMKGGTAALLLGLLALVIASFWTLNLKWGEFLSMEAFRSMGRFIAEFFPMDTQSAFLTKVGWAHLKRWPCHCWARAWQRRRGWLWPYLPANCTATTRA